MRLGGFVHRERIDKTYQLLAEDEASSLHLLYPYLSVLEPIFRNIIYIA